MYLGKEQYINEINNSTCYHRIICYANTANTIVSSTRHFSGASCSMTTEKNQYSLARFPYPQQHFANIDKRCIQEWTYLLNQSSVYLGNGYGSLLLKSYDALAFYWKQISNVWYDIEFLHEIVCIWNDLVHLKTK